MADIQGKFYNAVRPRTGTSPSLPPTLDGDPQDPVNPPGTNPNHPALTLGTNQNGLTLDVTNQILQLGLSSSSTTGALSSTDWSTFNGKIGGTGTINYVSKFTASGIIGNSSIQENNGFVAFGASPLTNANLRLSQPATAAITGYSIAVLNPIQSDVTSSFRSFQSSPTTQATSFTLNELYHYIVSQGAFGAGSTVSNQFGVYISSNMIGATNNYAFRSDINSGTGRWNLYMLGTANNYLAGNLWIGTSSGTNTLDVNGTARIRTISNATGNFLTTSATGVIQQRTAAEVKGDLFLNSGIIGGGSTILDFSYPSAGGARLVSGTGLLTDGAVVQVYGGSHPSLAGQMFLDYGSQVSTISGRFTQFRNLSIGTITNVMRLTDTNNVLINTITDGGYRLDVNGTARVQGNFIVSASNLVGIGTTSPAAFLDIVGSASNAIRIDNATAIQRMSFNSGIVGGSTSTFDTVYPSTGAYRIVGQVTGNNNFDGAAVQLFGATAASLAGQMYFDYGSQVRTVSGRSAYWRNINIGSITTVMALTSSSNVLINTTTDSGYRLDVNGTFRSQGDVTLSDTRNFILGTTTGTKIGTATTQKIALWNATPIVQPTTAISAATFVANTSGIVDDSATFDGYTIGQVVKALRNMGALS